MPKRDLVRVWILLILWLIAFAPLYPELIREWWGNSDNSHAFLVPFVTLYFVLRERATLADLPVAPSRAGAALFAVGLLGYLVAFTGGAAFPARLAMVLTLFGMLWFCLGNAIMRRLLFPLGFLFFMVPVPYSLISLVSLPLQLTATDIAARLIETCAIPVYREGNMLYFVQTQLEVAEACSGIRSIVSLTMIGLVLCAFARPGRFAKAVIVAAAVPIALVANIVRVTGTGILAHFYGDNVARGFLHQFSGLVIFALGFGLLGLVFLAVNSMWARHET